MQKEILTEEVKEKWKPIIESEGVAAIKDPAIRNITIRLLENQVNDMNEATAATGTTAGLGDGTNSSIRPSYDPVLISLVRRTAPSLIAHELMGVQPMSMPTGLIFAMKSYATDVRAAGSPTEVYSPLAGAPDPTLSGKYGTDVAEKMGTVEEVAGGAGDPANDPVVQNSPWNQMSFTIEKTSVEAQTRALKAHYTTELAQDLRAVHGLDAETELANLLSGELTAEINREIVNTIVSQAIPTLNTTSYSHATAGGFDFFDYTAVIAAEGIYNIGGATPDSGGRWEAEHFKNIIGMINRVAHEVALGTRRGLGNRVITNPVMAAGLDMVSKLDPARDVASGANMSNNNIGITYAGRLLGKYDVYVDPYMTANTIVVGYKGSSAYDAGYYYCPYVPFTMMKAQGENDFQPRIGFKTRYGMKNNPFTTGTAGQNWYYRKFTVTE